MTNKETFETRLAEFKDAQQEYTTVNTAGILLFKDYLNKMHQWYERLGIIDKFHGYIYRTPYGHNLVYLISPELLDDIVSIEDFESNYLTGFSLYFGFRGLDIPILYAWLCWETFKHLPQFQLYSDLSNPYESSMKILLRGNHLNRGEMATIEIESTVIKKEYDFVLPSLDYGFLDFIDSSCKRLGSDGIPNQKRTNELWEEFQKSPTPVATSSTDAPEAPVIIEKPNVESVDKKEKDPIDEHDDSIVDNSMDFSRHKKTLMYLLSATAICWIFAFFGQVVTILALMTPIIFGIAVVLSNKEYLKYKLSNVIIYISFFIIFYFGTVPFGSLAHLITDNRFVLHAATAIGAFFLVSLTVRLNLKETTIGYFQVILTIILSLVSLVMISALTGRDISNPNTDMLKRFDLVILVYQFFMSINILAMLKMDQYWIDS